MPSGFTIEQASTVLNNVYEQITGKQITAVTNTADFVSVAQTLLQTGRDPVLNAISQMWSRSIFAYRDYKAPFNTLEMDLDRFGNAVRKLSPVAREMADDESFIYPVAYDAVNYPLNPYGDGVSVDMWEIAKQKVQQLNFYGTAVYQQKYTIFKDQFDNAFSSADEFGRFNAMMMTERNNEKEQYKEAVGRGIQLNFIGALIDEANTDRVIHLLTEYNTVTGQSLTAQTVMQSVNYVPFIRWVWARIKTLVRLMGTRSYRFQTVVNAEPVLRFTRPENMRIALLASAYDQIETMAMSDTYHDDYLKGITFESVDFWQSIDSPDEIDVTPVYTSTVGAVTTGSAVQQTGVFGILHDKDALGYSMVNSWSAVTPLNIDGGYWNESYHARIKTIQDNTEKAVVLLLD
ncbi:MAG: hypothetical protein IKY66_07495 [Bacteroidales bacterium]|nr:hypothetical protein [Bacteroidales bacterium]